MADLASKSGVFEKEEWPSTPETGKWVINGVANKAKITTLLNEAAIASTAGPTPLKKSSSSSDDDKPLATRKR